MLTQNPIVTKLLALGFSLLGGGRDTLLWWRGAMRICLSSLKLRKEKTDFSGQFPGCWINQWKLLEVEAVEDRVPLSGDPTPASAVRSKGLLEQT